MSLVNQKDNKHIEEIYKKVMAQRGDSQKAIIDRIKEEEKKNYLATIEPRLNGMLRMLVDGSLKFPSDAKRDEFIRGFSNVLDFVVMNTNTEVIDRLVMEAEQKRRLEKIKKNE